MPSTPKKGRQAVPPGATLRAYGAYLSTLDSGARPNYAAIAQALDVRERTLKNWWTKFRRKALARDEDYIAVARWLSSPTLEELKNMRGTSASERHQIQTLKSYPEYLQLRHLILRGHSDG